MKVLLLSKYSRLGASSRIRSHQYIPYLTSQNIDITISPLLNDNYLHRIYNNLSKPKLSVLLSYLKRIKLLLTQKKFDVLWIEYELFPWIPLLEELLLKFSNIPYIVDYDDAIFNNYEMHQNIFTRSLLKNKIKKVMKNAAVVITGNNYLKNYALNAGARQVNFIPTVIDLNHYKKQASLKNSVCTLGWIGTPATEKYLSLIKPALMEVSKKIPLKLLIVGGKSFKVDNLEIEYIDWHEETEASNIYKMDIGLMPLVDDEWTRGKCGYKLIQYMACAKPVIASPVSANCDIVDHQLNGLLANSTQEWVDAILTLATQSDLREQFGLAGQKKIEASYCVQVTAEEMVKTFKSLRVRSPTE
jgi:glycosyltransferase involved in cell wall biosynthesis